MQDLLVKAAEQTPALAVLCFLVWIFLKSMDKRDKFIERLHDEHLDARTMSRKSLDDNTVGLARNTMAVDQLSSAVRNMK